MIEDLEQALRSETMNAVTRRWGPHHKLESRPNLPFNGFSNGL